MLGGVVHSELKRIALWTAGLFVPFSFFGFYLVAPHGGLGNAVLAPIGLLVILPGAYLSEIGIWSGPLGLVVYVAQYLWCFLWVALGRWLIRKASNAEQRASAAKPAP